jgi:uncharacterized membrane protein
MNYMSYIIIIVVCIFSLFGSGETTYAADSESEIVPDTVTLMKGRVLHIVTEANRTIPGTDTPTTFQTIEAEILTGTEAGKHITIDNDYLNLKEGEAFYLTHTVSSFDGSDYYLVNDPYRLPQLGFIVGLFIILVFVFGGKQGIRGLLSLLGSFACIFFLLLPGILHGYSPLLLTISISSLIIILGSYITHGFTRTTSAAVLGMIATVSITGLLAYWSVYFTRLSGFGSEEAVYLNMNARGGIDIIGLLLGGIIIGLLGVLYDAAIGQAVSVEELARIAKDASRRTIYERALRIGREHIGALVNTLAIAYVGAALPLLLLFYQTTEGSVLHIINTELFATEIVRIMIGSIGLVLAVPVTTLIATLMLTKHAREQTSQSHIHNHHYHH